MSHHVAVHAASQLLVTFQAAHVMDWHHRLAQLFFRAIPQDGLTIMFLKQLYAKNGMLKDEHADLALVKVDTVEEMCQLISGSAHIIAVDNAEKLGDARTDRGDLTV